MAVHRHVQVDEHFSLERAYVVLRTLGLRHLIVVDVANRVRGIVTRKVSLSLLWVFLLVLRHWAWVGLGFSSIQAEH